MERNLKSPCLGQELVEVEVQGHFDIGIVESVQVADILLQRTKTGRSVGTIQREVAHIGKVENMIVIINSSFFTTAKVLIFSKPHNHNM